MPERDRARGALYGLAIGDALGMPTEGFARQQVIERWGPLLTGFQPAPPDNPIAAGLPAGTVTDDTEQAVLLGRHLIRRRGAIDPVEWAADLADWERDMAARGRHGLLGPSTKRAVAAVLAGTPPEEAGLGGDTNGAAMRITPVGIAFPPGCALIEHIEQACLVTHNTPVAIAGAAAVAAAVSGGIVSADAPRSIQAGLTAARSFDASLAARVERAVAAIRGCQRESVAHFIVGQVGTSLATSESVPAAFAVLSAVPGDPWQACLLAASLGGDSDTIAAMAGAMAGAVHGKSAFPEHAVATIDAHGLHLDDLADALLALCKRLHDLGSVHFAKRVGQELQAGPVRVLEVDRRPARDAVRHAGGVELAAQVLPLLLGDRDRDVVQVPQGLPVRLEVKAGEVEEREQVPVADVEEEVVRPLVVPVAEDLGQRELQQPLVELDRLLDVGADERRMVDAARRRRRVAWREVLRLQPGALGLDRGDVDLRVAHDGSVPVPAPGKRGQFSETLLSSAATDSNLRREWTASADLMGAFRELSDLFPLHSGDVDHQSDH
jgi:ADP-ribosylglycohydrolase